VIDGFVETCASHESPLSHFGLTLDSLLSHIWVTFESL
jgi:hypothetical protein